jgi:hypothetical protein
MRLRGNLSGRLSRMRPAATAQHEVWRRDHVRDPLSNRWKLQFGNTLVVVNNVAVGIEKYVPNQLAADGISLRRPTTVDL